MKLPCPSIARRPLEGIERWPGNVAVATATADETTEITSEMDCGPTCGPHDFRVLPAGTAGGVRQLYCRGCGGVLEIAKAKRLEGE